MNPHVPRLWEPIGRIATVDGYDRAWLDAKLGFLAFAHPGATIRLMVPGRSEPVAVVRSLIGEAADETVSTTIDHPALGGSGEAEPLARRLRQAAMALLGPVYYDELRQRANDRSLAEFERTAPRVGRPAASTLRVAGAGGPAVLVGMYWLELGGAEKWAITTIPIIRSVGLTPIILIDRRAPQRLLGAPELDGAIVLSAEDEPEPARSAAIESLFATFDIRAVVIHHSDLLYDELPRIRQIAGDIPVVDTTHVVEWENGGYPMRSAQHAALIDIHHVISTTLGDYLEAQGVAPAAIAVAPLTDLGFSGASCGRPRDGVTRLGFVGRLVRQKRPWLFLELLRRLHRLDPAVRGIVHGDGPLRDETIRRAGLIGVADFTEFRTPATPVAATYDDIDVLVITSQTEGLTLTAMEAIARGVLVVSADVGAQRELVAGAALLPRRPLAFLTAGTQLLRRLARDTALRAELLAEQRRKADALLSMESASAWFTRLVAGWGKQ